MDNITFTGLKNIGGVTCHISGIASDMSLKRSNLIVNLTDDCNGKDLTEFKNVVKKCALAAKVEDLHGTKNLLHIMTSVIEDGKDIPTMAMNWNIIKPSKTTLPLFSYIAKLTRQISSMPDKDFVVDNDFKYGPDGDSLLIPGEKISESIQNPKQIKQVFDTIYSPHSGKKIAANINSDIQKEMEDYFRV